MGSRPRDGPGAVVGDPLVTPDQRTLGASPIVDPGERRTYEGIFTEPVWYGVAFTVDGRVPENETGVTAFTPAPSNGERGTFLTGTV